MNKVKFFGTILGQFYMKNPSKMLSKGFSCDSDRIKEDFYNKHNAHNTAAAKIFLKNFFVNTKTGEMPIIVSSAPKLK